MKGKVKLGFIGSGSITEQHLDHGLKGFPDVQFVGWCDVKEETAAARKEQVGGQGKIYTDVAKMIVDSKPDAVYIMVPPFAHGPAEDAVIKYKVPFMVEKPIAIDWAVMKRTAAGVKKQNLLTSVGYMTRYRRSAQRVKELMARQTPVMMHGGWVGGPDFVEDHWWLHKDQSGGQFLEQTTHDTDLARYLFGEAESVYAIAINDRQKHQPYHTIEDASMVQIRFLNGAVANFYSSCCTPVSGQSGVSLTLWTTGMYAEFTGWEHSVKILLPGQEEICIKGEDNIFALEDRAFIDSVKAGRNKGILCSYEDGMKSVAIGIAANESMETGKVVKLAK